MVSGEENIPPFHSVDVATIDYLEFSKLKSSLKRKFEFIDTVIKIRQKLLQEISVQSCF